MFKIIVSSNTTWSIVNFRSGLLRSLVSAGHRVTVAAPQDQYRPHLENLGCRYVPLPMDNKGTNPWKDAKLLFSYSRLFQSEKPDLYLGFTIKPNIYGSIVAHLYGVPVINNITGLGSAFIANDWLSIIVRILYRISLSRSIMVLFQNEDDRRLFVEDGLIAAVKSERLPGSGIDLSRFKPSAPPSRSVTRFLLIGRLLWDKGVGEFVEAARILKARGRPADFCLLGFLDAQNPTAISRQIVEQWVIEGVVRYLGASDDVRPHIAEADCIVLPSYREGVPRSLLEAAAMGRPIITTDSVGCREVVEHGVNGYLCRPRDVADLAEKMEMMITLSTAERERMGRRGREKVEREFDEQIVIRKYHEIIEQLLSRKRR